MTLKELNTNTLFSQPITPPHDFDLAIVGAGIVGLTLAAALKDSGLSVVLIERSPQSVAVTMGRAYAISLMSGRILQGLGVWAKILPQITTFEQIAISDTDYPGIVNFYPQDLGTKGLGYAAEHRVLLTTLQEHLQHSPNIHWLCPAEVVKVNYQPDLVEISVNTDATNNSSLIRTKLIIAADGARSPIRTTAGIKTKGWKYWQSCVVATIKPEKPHNNIAYERFWHTGPMGVLPLTENRFQVVWTSPHAEAQRLKELDSAEFLKILETRTAGLLGRLELQGDRYVFPVQLMQSDDYIKPRLALIGDAAHCCHPVAGQGMNLGIRDAAALAEILTTAHHKGEDIGNINILKRYENWRKNENIVILGFTDFLDRMFSNNWLLIVIIRRMGLWMLRNISPLKIYALQLMTGLRGRYPKRI